jgi:hypothetical protein
MTATSLFLLQKGQSSALVVLFFPSAIGGLGGKIQKALGSQPSIVIDQTAKGTEDLEQILRFARSSTGTDDLWLACLGGFSAGCQRVRALCLAGGEAKSYLFIDGAHASLPPADWQIDYLKQLVERARQETTTLVLTHTYIVTEPQLKYTSTAGVARLVTGWPLPKPPAGSYTFSTSGLLSVYSVSSEPVDPLAHIVQANVWLPMVLDRHVRALVEPGYRPGGLPRPPPPTPPAPLPAPQGGGAGIPGKIFTASEGWLDLETDYLPRVVTRENGNAASAALEAQAIAARTYVLRAMLDHPSLGTPAQPIINSEKFQTYAATATAQCIDATRRTAGIVATYSHQLILGNYVAGAIWTPSGVPGQDTTNTEKWVTYNKGKTGTFVKPTALASTARWENRGCMSQNGADWLARHGEGHLAILRFFYGLDLELVDLRGARPVPAPPGPGQQPAPVPQLPESDAPASPSSGDDGAAFFAFAGVGLGWMLQR